MTKFEKKKFSKKNFFLKILAPKFAFWPQISTQKAKFAQKYFFRDPEAPRFPTRGHMPMFEKIRFFGPETDRRARILENRSFRTKSVSVSFLQFWFPNFSPKISKILRAIFQKNSICFIFGSFLAISGRFGTVRPDFFENRNFFGKTLGSVSYPYSKEPSCKK